MANVWHNSGLARLRQCEQQYTYEYIDRLKPRSLSVHLIRGSWFHALMQAHNLRLGMEAGTLLDTPDTFDLGFDRIAPMKIDDKHGTVVLYTEEGKSYALSPEDVHRAIIEQFYDYLPIVSGDDFDGLDEQVWFLFERYLHRWQQESRRERVLLVEHEWQRRSGRGDLYGGKADLVVERDGLLIIRDHKTTGQKPGADYRLRNSQLHLYAWGLAPFLADALDGREPEAVEYDYAITRDVAQVTLTKTGRLRSNQATMDPYAFQTLFLQAVEDWKQEYGEEYGPQPDAALEAFDEHMAKCREDEEENGKYFSREVMPVNVTVIKRLLAENANLIDTATELAQGTRQPTANTSKQCRWCDYSDLCIGDMYGNDTSTLIADHYVKDE